MTQASPSRGAELARWIDRARRRLWGGRPLPVWYHPLYRFPIHDLRETTGIEPLRADFALWSLIGAHNRHRIDVHEPTRAPYELMSRVHTPAYLESLTRLMELSWGKPVPAIQQFFTATMIPDATPEHPVATDLPENSR